MHLLTEPTPDLAEPDAQAWQARVKKLSATGDPLLRLNALIAWQRFRPLLKKVRKLPRKSPAGRKPFDELLMFKVLILQRLYNLSDYQTEFQIRDRLSFMRFLNVQWQDPVPDEKTIWLFRQQLIHPQRLTPLFSCFEDFLYEQGFGAKTGSIIDASIVQVPRQRNHRTENAQLKRGETPAAWLTQPAKLCPKDQDAR